MITLALTDRIRTEDIGRFKLRPLKRSSQEDGAFRPFCWPKRTLFLHVLLVGDGNFVRRRSNTSAASSSLPWPASHRGLSGAWFGKRERLGQSRCSGSWGCACTSIQMHGRNEEDENGSLKGERQDVLHRGGGDDDLWHKQMAQQRSNTGQHTTIADIRISGGRSVTALTYHRSLSRSSLPKYYQIMRQAIDI